MARKPPPPGPAGSEAMLEELVLSLASGILLAAPFLQPWLAPLHYVALVPWALLLIRPGHGPGWRGRLRFPLLFLVGAFAFFAMAFGPMSLLNKAIPFAIGAVFAPPFLFFPVFLRVIHRRWSPPLVVLLPVVWVAAEWLRIALAPGTMGLFPLGASQAHWTPLIQIAEITGLAGVSFVVAAVNGALADLWLRRRVLKGQLWPTAWPAVAALGLLGGVLLYGAVRLPAVRGAHTEGPRIALVQPDMLHYRDAERTRQLFENELTFTRERVPPGSVDLIAWPENAVDDVLSRDPLYLRELARLARELRASVVTGAFTWASPEAAARAPRSVRGEPVHTSAYVFTAEGDIAGRYDKIYLIPWAEKAPGGTLPLLGPGSVALGEALLGYRARDVPGERVELFPVTRGATAEARFATPICYEVSSPAFCRRAVRNGADFLLNISSEGLMGAPIYNHMWNLSLFRAVEVRLPIARAGNHGISGFIDATGAPYAVLQGETTGRPYREPGVLLATMRLYRDGGSLYARVGDLFSYLCLGISVVLTLAAGRPRRRA